MSQGYTPPPGQGNKPVSPWSPAYYHQAPQGAQQSMGPAGSQPAGAAYHTQTQPQPNPNFKPGIPGWQAVPPPKRKSPKTLILILAAVALLAGGVVWGTSALRNKQIKESIAPYELVYAPNIFINDVPLGGLGTKEAYTRLRAAMDERIRSWNLGVTFNGHQFKVLDYSTLGIQITDEELYVLLNEAWHLTHKGDIHAQKAAIDALIDTPHKAYTTQKEFQNTLVREIFNQIAGYINTPPADALLLEFRPDEENPFVFQKERYGYQLDVDAAIDEVMGMAAQGQSGNYELKPEILQPKTTQAMLEATVKLRTSITTGISADSIENRNHNIRLSLQKINGTILKPGQNFSFNDTVGPRTLEAGFAEAEEYAYGDLVIGVGGGVCQASTTLYQAALTAGLSISRRYPHSGPVEYTKLGQDATVYLTKDRNLDFQFKNTTAGSIYITAHVKPARNNSKRLNAVINIYGLDLGDGISYRLRSEVVQELEPPAEKIYENDNTGKYATYTDEEKLKTKAVKGQVIETFLEKYQNGVLVEQPKLISSDTFRAKAAVYYRGVNKRP